MCVFHKKCGGISGLVRFDRPNLPEKPTISLFLYRKELENGGNITFVTAWKGNLLRGGGRELSTPVCGKPKEPNTC